MIIDFEEILTITERFDEILFRSSPYRFFTKFVYDCCLRLGVT